MLRLISIIFDACHLELRPSLHALIFWNGTHDSVSALVCATGYHAHHCQKFGNRPNVLKAIASNNFSFIRASSHASAKAFWNEFGIQSFRLPEVGNSQISTVNTVVSSACHTASIEHHETFTAKVYVHIWYCPFPLRGKLCWAT